MYNRRIKVYAQMTIMMTMTMLIILSVSTASVSQRYIYLGRCSHSPINNTERLQKLAINALKFFLL